MVTKRVLPGLLALALLGGCMSFGSGGTKETVGTVGGAVAGGLIGSQIGGGSGKLVATGVGTLLGAFVGNQIGASLDKTDHAMVEQATAKAYSAPVGEKITWNNTDSGHSGSVVSTREGWNTTGNYCREIQQAVKVGKDTHQAYGTACKQPDGTWKIVSAQP